MFPNLNLLMSVALFPQFVGRRDYRRAARDSDASDVTAPDPDNEDDSTLLKEEPIYTEMPELTLCESVRTANFW